MSNQSNTTRGGEKLPVTRLFQEMATRKIVPARSRIMDAQVNMYCSVLFRIFL